jgi:hypothetical protein
MFISGGGGDYWTSDISTFWDDPHVLWNDTYWRVLYIKHMFFHTSIICTMKIFWSHNTFYNYDW